MIRGLLALLLLVTMTMTGCAAESPAPAVGLRSSIIDLGGPIKISVGSYSDDRAVIQLEGESGSDPNRLISSARLEVHDRTIPARVTGGALPDGTPAMTLVFDDDLPILSSVLVLTTTRGEVRLDCDWPNL